MNKIFFLPGTRALQFYYASRDVKSKFVADQSVLVQALDDFKRETNRTFTEVGLADYWKCHPKSIRRCSPPCFDVMIRRRTKEVECAAPPDEQRWWFLQRSPFNTKSSSKHGTYCFYFYGTRAYERVNNDRRWFAKSIIFIILRWSMWQVSRKSILKTAKLKLTW